MAKSSGWIALPLVQSYSDTAHSGASHYRITQEGVLFLALCEHACTCTCIGMYTSQFHVYEILSDASNIDKLSTYTCMYTRNGLVISVKQ